MKKKLMLLGLVLLLIGGVAGYLLYQKPHRDIGRASSDYVVTATALFREFEENEEAANSKYLDKVIKVRGRLSASETDTDGHVVLVLDAGDEMFGVSCTIPKENAAGAASFKIGQEVTIKGVCTGKLMDVVLIRCVPQVDNRVAKPVESKSKHVDFKPYEKIMDLYTAAVLAGRYACTG